METGEIGRLSGQIDRNREQIVDVRIEVALILERVAHAVSRADLEKLEKDIMAAVDVKIAHICEHLTSANREQSKDLVNEWRNQREADNQARMAAHLADREAIIGAVKERRSRWVWWALGIVGGLIVSAGSIALGVWIAGAR